MSLLKTVEVILSILIIVCECFWPQSLQFTAYIPQCFRYMLHSFVFYFISAQVQFSQVWKVWMQSWSQGVTLFLCNTASTQTEDRKRKNNESDLWRSSKVLEDLDLLPDCNLSFESHTWNSLEQDLFYKALLLFQMHLFHVNFKTGSQGSATRGSFIPLRWLPVEWVYNTQGRCPPDF